MTRTRSCTIEVNTKLMQLLCNYDCGFTVIALVRIFNVFDDLLTATNLSNIALDASTISSGMTLTCSNLAKHRSTNFVSCQSQIQG